MSGNNLTYLQSARPIRDGCRLQAAATRFESRALWRGSRVIEEQKETDSTSMNFTKTLQGTAELTLCMGNVLLVKPKIEYL